MLNGAIYRDEWDSAVERANGVVKFASMEIGYRVIPKEDIWIR